MGVDLIVAPYEADAQLAFLNIQKFADYVITEDSDLVLFGCHHVRFVFSHCALNEQKSNVIIFFSLKKILFKLDENGHGEMFDRNELNLKREFGLESFERFIWMCILSGCDYLDNIAGIGLVKAKKIMSRTKVSDIELVKKL